MSMLSVDDILRDIAAHPGCAVGVPFVELSRIWDSISTQCFRTVVQRRTLIVPNFCHFYFSAKTMDQKPQFIFSPNFCASYGVTTLQPHLSRVTHISQGPNLTLNPSVIAVQCGVTRESVSNTLKDVIRKIGEVVLNGKGGNAVCVEFADLCKVIVRRGGRYDVHWSGKAVAHMNTTTRGLELLSKRASNTDDLPPKKVVEQAPPPASPPMVIEVRAKPKTQRPVSAPAQRTVTPPPPQEVVEEEQETQRSPSSAAGGLHTSTLVPFTSRAALPPSRYLQHKSHKAKVRRGRQETYVDSWESQLGRKRELREHDFAQAVIAQDDYHKHLAEEESRDVAARKEARNQEAKVRDINTSLQRGRHSTFMPRAHQMGSIFTGRTCNHSVPPDLGFLSRQIGEHEARRRRERDEEIKCGGRLVEHDRVLMEAERTRRLEMKDALRREQQSLDPTPQGGRADGAHLMKWGGDMFFGNLTPSERKLEEKRQKLAAQEEALKLQLANQEVVRQRDKDAQRVRNQVRNELRMSSREAIEREGVQRSHRHRVTRNMQNELASAWDTQVSEKTRVHRAETERQKQWRDVSYWTNASSDDEM